MLCAISLLCSEQYEKHGFHVCGAHVLLLTVKGSLIAEYMIFHRTAPSELQRSEPQVCELEETLGPSTLVNQHSRGLISAREATDHLTTFILSKRG